MLAAMGGSPVLAETTEIFGAEHLLVRRARNREVGERLLSFVAATRNISRQFEGGSFDDNPSPGNKEGGLTNILEKVAGRGGEGGQFHHDRCRRLCRAHRYARASTS